MPRSTLIIIIALSACLCMVVGVVLFWRLSNPITPRRRRFSSMFSDLVETGYISPEVKESEPKELPRRDVQILETLGSGAFGDVRKGIVNLGGSDVLVAIKTTKGDDDAREELLQEALLMHHFGKHANLVSLVGIVMVGDPLLVLVSF